MKTNTDNIAEALKRSEDNEQNAGRYILGLDAKRVELDDLYIKLYAVVNSGKYELLNNDMYDLIDRAENLSRDLTKLIDEMRKA